MCTYSIEKIKALLKKMSSVHFARVSVVILGFVICGFFLSMHGNSFDSKVTASPSSEAKTNLYVLKEKYIRSIKEKGPQEAYADFVKSVDVNSDITTHDQAHVFGEALYDTQGITGLQYCDSSFDFGCYHSFFGVAVSENGISVLKDFDTACRTKFGDYNLPCQHGIGHGILIYTGYSKLEEALTFCETISTMPTGGCSSGVFMEYNFHTMDTAQDGGYLRKAESDLYAPCDTLPLRFQESCYNEQVQWWQNIYNSDFEYIGSLCQRLESITNNYAACFHGIGNYLAALVSLKNEEIVVGCKKMPTAQSEAFCIEGASWLVRADGSGLADAKALCTSLGSPYTEECLKKVDY